MAISMAAKNSRNNRNNNKRHPFARIKRKSRLVYLKILRIDDPPERIALGAAIGVLMGILPTFGVGAVLSLITAFFFNANKAAAVLGSFIMNPLTSPFFWTASIVLGSYLLGVDSAEILARVKNESFLNGLSHAYIAFLSGNAVIATVLSVTSYYVVRKAVTGHRRRKEEKREAKLAREREQGF